MPIAEMFGESGRIAQRLLGYESRPQQIEMAAAVENAFSSRRHLFVEAGTGVGKSFAYLVPAIDLALRDNTRVVISTHTIALQEQLIQKDIPFLRSVFDQEFSAELVKGRSNYLGLRRLARTSGKQRVLFTTEEELTELWGIEDWAYKTTDGSLADLTRAPSLAVWERVKSETEDCLGRRCPQYGQCFYQRARRRAAQAQLLIVNHALLFSDLALRRRSVSLLPPYDYLVLDEAHTVETVAGDHLGLSLSDAQVRHLLNTMYNERTRRGVLSNRNYASCIRHITDVRRATREYFQSLPKLITTLGDGATERLREPPSLSQPISASLLELRERIRQCREDSENEEDRSELAALMERCTAMANSLDEWHHQKNEGWVHWAEINGTKERVTLNARPIEVGSLLREHLFDSLKSVVLTSATLTTSSDNPFGYIQCRLQLENVAGLTLGSPFDFARQMSVYVEEDMPDPADAEKFLIATCEAVKKHVLRSRGRAFVLFTNFEMLRRCAAALSGFFAEHSMPLWVHDAGASRSALLDAFRSHSNSVLFGADTFWQGVDVPGDELSNVIIVKLPFAVPSHPVVEARVERIRADGGNPFMDFQVPEAVLRFKQGVGRLIRTQSDTGSIVILDPRIIRKPYGKRFLAALPKCRIIRESLSGKA